MQDAVTRQTVPRRYVHSLEERVAFLELKLQEHGIVDYDASTPKPTPILSPHDTIHPPQLPVVKVMQRSPATDPDVFAAAQSTLDDVLTQVQRHSGYEPVFSKLLLTGIMNCRTSLLVARACEPTDQTRNTVHLFETVNDLDTSPAPLPDSKGAQYLTRIYFEFVTDSYPLLHEQTFREMLKEVYNVSGADLDGSRNTNDSGLSIFFVFMVFAIALLVLQQTDGSGVPMSLCDRYHKTALRVLKERGLPTNVEGVQALLLITQYSYFLPSIQGVCTTIGIALRLAVELGLHRDPCVGRVDHLTLDTMRRTFWVAYAMDRTVTIILGLPSCLADGSITAQFPSEADDKFIRPDGIHWPERAARGLKRYSNHLLRYRQLQSEMQTVLCEEVYPALHPIDYEQWQRNIHERIETWYNCSPSDHLPGNLELKTVPRPHWELGRHRAMLFLYRPSPKIPSPSASSLIALSESSRKVIHLYRQIFLENRVTILWQAIENVFSAGIALLYSYVHSAQVQESTNLRSLEADTHMCSSILWGLVEHVPAMKAKRDAFDTLTTKILADLNNTYDDRDERSGGDLSPEATSACVAALSSSFTHEAPSAGQYPMATNPADAANSDLLASTNATPESSFRTDLGIHPTDQDDSMAIDWEAFENGNGLRPASQSLFSTWL